MPHTGIVRFAVVGVKGYSRSHLRLVQTLAEQGRAQLVASMMVDKLDHLDIVSQFEAEGIQVFDDYASMLEACTELVDVVTLPVPIYVHAPMAVDALQAGYHVLVEKPVAGSLPEVDGMIAARDKSGRQCAVGFQQIYSPVFQTLKKHIAAGKLGEVERISIMALWPRAPSYYARNEWAGRLFCNGRPVYDSPFNNALAHQIMNMLYLASAAPNQAAQVKDLQAELYRAYNIESFDTGCMRALTDSGVEIIFATTHACRVNVDPIMRLEAGRARVEWQIGSGATVTYANGSTELIEESSPRDHMAGNICDTVLGISARPMCTLEIGRAHVACIQAVHETTEIQTIPPRFLSETQGGQRIIVGIEEAVQSTFDSGQLFTEHGSPFASTS